MSGFALNLILALQMIWYWNAPSAKAKGKRKAEPIAAPKGSATSTGTAPNKGGPTTRRRG